jgi:transketolase
MPRTEFTDLLRRTRLRLLRMHYEARAGHLGGNFSCIDLMMVLHHQVMEPDDRFVLSKGHSAGALYATLWSQGKLSDADLTTFSQNDSLLPGHPSGVGIPDLLFSTGSLGHGPSLAVGLALAGRHTADGHAPRRVFCLCSDGEWQEGSCWEALTMAVHQRLRNLVLIIDQNGLQGFGETAEVISCADLTPRLRGFGAEVRVIDAHDPEAIRHALAEPFAKGPGIVVANSIKGRGLPYAGRLESHYLPLDEVQYREAVATLTAAHGGAA